MSKLVVTITDKEGNIIDTKTYAVPVLNEKGEKVLPDGADEELDIYSGQISYMIQEYEETQFVTVTAVDAAGNDTSIEEEGGNNHTVPAISFTLSTKWYVRWYNDKPFFYGTIGAGVGVVALALIAVLLIKRRKDKKKEREA